MEIIWGFISDILGAYTRYFFYKLIGKAKPIEYLQGYSDDGANSVSHTFINTIIGLIVLIPIMLGIVKIMDIFGIL